MQLPCCKVTAVIAMPIFLIMPVDLDCLDEGNGMEAVKQQ